MTKCALICGAGEFIGGHLVKRLKKDGFWVRGVDLKFHEFSETSADDFVVGDLRDQGFCRAIVDRRFDEVYQLAADMGGAGLFSPASMTPTLCTTRFQSIRTCLTPATSATSRRSSIHHQLACIRLITRKIR